MNNQANNPDQAISSASAQSIGVLNTRVDDEKWTDCANFYRIVRSDSSTSSDFNSTLQCSITKSDGPKSPTRQRSSSLVPVLNLCPSTHDNVREPSTSNDCNMKKNLCANMTSPIQVPSSSRSGDVAEIPRLNQNADFYACNMICRETASSNNSQRNANQSNNHLLNISPAFGWQATKSTLKDRMAFMCLNEAFADVYFIFKKDGALIQRIPAHKFVLIIGSAVFEAMFRFDESNAQGYNNCIKEIELVDIDPPTLVALLTFLYTDDVNITSDSVMSILYAAKKYSVPALELLCVNFLKENLSVENAFILLTQARLFDEPTLAGMCLEIIDRGCAEAFEAEGFTSIDRETLRTVLKRDSLRLNELELFNAVMRWVHEACSRQSLALTQENQRAVLGDVLLLIRFPLMEPKDLATIVAPTKLLTDSEMVRIFLHYFNNNSKNETKETTSSGESESLAFLDKPRGCILAKEYAVNRFQRIEASWGYSGTPDRIKFSVDLPVLIIGFGLYGSTRESVQYPVTIEIINFSNGKTLARNETSFLSDGSPSTFRVLFKEPVEITAGTTYIASAKLVGNKESHYGSKGLRKITMPLQPSVIPQAKLSNSQQPNTITWYFSYAAGNNNGTSVDDGQIPEIIFCTNM